MDHRGHDLPQIVLDQRLSNPTTVAYGIALVYLIYHILVYFNFRFSSPIQICWKLFIYIVPTRLLLDKQKLQELKGSNMLAQTHAAKSEALKKLFGEANGVALLRRLPGEGIGLARETSKSAAPPGLGNWDNSCYQNSVLQGLAALDGLRPFLQSSVEPMEDLSGSTGASLLHTVDMLNSNDNNGKRLWTPAKLKSMSSWQQQDAQEYFSKIMDELDKEAARALTNAKTKHGLEAIAENVNMLAAETEREPQGPRNPMEGYLAQRVACTKCGYTEGLSMIPFNCVTVPLGASPSYDLEDCFDEYSKLEEIPEVECSKCTLQKWERQLELMLSAGRESQDVDKSRDETAKALSLPPELRAQTFARLNAIKNSLEEDDFSDKALNIDCQIPKKGRVSSTKSRQAVFMRAPQCLVVHINRSVFDEFSGIQRKNYAAVRYPHVLDLRSWLLDQAATAKDKEGAQASAATNAVESMLSDATALRPRCSYRLKAVITHYGRHENGHYICYRHHGSQQPEAKGDDVSVDSETSDWQRSSKSRWWRLSDEDVSPVSEEEVLDQGGVFMLFYEREFNDEEVALGEQTTELNMGNSAIEGGMPDEENAAAVAPQSLLNDTVPVIADSVPAQAVVGVAEENPHATGQALVSPACVSTSPPVPQTEISSDYDGDATSKTQSARASTPMMRTSHRRRSSRRSLNETAQRFGNVAFRPVAAT